MSVIIGHVFHYLRASLSPIFGKRLSEHRSAVASQIHTEELNSDSAQQNDVANASISLTFQPPSYANVRAPAQVCVQNTSSEKFFALSAPCARRLRGTTAPRRNHGENNSGLHIAAATGIVPPELRESKLGLPRPKSQLKPGKLRPSSFTRPRRTEEQWECQRFARRRGNKICTPRLRVTKPGLRRPKLRGKSVKLHKIRASTIFSTSTFQLCCLLGCCRGRRFRHLTVPSVTRSPRKHARPPG